MRTNQKGFSVVEILIVVVVVGLIGGAGWYVTKARNNTVKDSAKTSDTQTQQGSDNTASTQKNDESLTKYTNSKLDISFNHPKEWTPKDYDELACTDCKTQSYTIGLVEPDPSNYGAVESVTVYVTPVKSNDRTVDFYLSGDHYFITKAKEIKVGGIRAAQFRWQDTQFSADTSSGQPHIGTFFIKDDKTYYISYKYINENSINKYLKGYDSIIETLAFN